MPREWREATLGDVCDTITDGAHASPASVDDGMPMASVKDLTRYGIEMSGCRKISRRDFDKLVRDGCQPRRGDVLMAKDGASCLETVCVFDQPDELVLLSSVAISRPGSDLDAHFLRYYLEWPQTKALLRGGYVSGSAIPRVVLRDFKAAPIPLPPLPVQRSIARVLRALDDKIELNRKMNETLEQMARAIFKSWFVDFEPFRDEGMVESELGPIPKGWTVGRLGDVLKQRVERCEASDETAARPYVPIECISPKSLSLEESRPGIEAQSSLTKFYKGDLLFGAMRPYFHKVCIAPFDGTTRTTAFVLHSSTEEDFAFATLLLHHSDTIDYATRHSTGSTIPYAVWSGSLEEMPAVMPPPEVRIAFDKTVRPILKRIPVPYYQNRTLAAIRDALLPKLMSGEIRTATDEVREANAGGNR